MRSLKSNRSIKSKSYKSYRSYRSFKTYKSVRSKLEFQLENDGILGVKAASPNGKGICSINGTGTVTVGVDDRGQFLQVGGVGYISGDEAGGSFIVRRTYQAVYDSFYRSLRLILVRQPYMFCLLQM